MTRNDDTSVGEEVDTDDDTHVFQNGDSALFSYPEVLYFPVQKVFAVQLFPNMEIF